MQISTTVRHCEMDSDLRAFARQRLERVSRFARDIREAHLTITAEKSRHVAEVTLRLDHRELVSREESIEMRAAIDGAVDRIEEQLRRHKDRRVDHREARNGAAEPTPITPAEEDEEFEA
jgi:putative sigma-54 modulation protein